MRGSNPENKLERMDIPIPIPNSSSIRMKKKKTRKGNYRICQFKEVKPLHFNKNKL